MEAYLKLADLDKLTLEILAKAWGSKLSYMKRLSDQLEIYFNEPLTPSEKAELDQVVAEHVP